MSFREHAKKAVLTLLALSVTVSAHPLDQVRAKLEAAGDGWKATVWMEAWAAYPEGGSKAPPGPPGDPDTAGKAWMETLDAQDFEAMGSVLGEFLRHSLLLSLNGESLDFELSLVGLKASPPQYEINKEGNAVIEIDLAGEFPVGEGGSLELVWSDDDDQPLTIEVLIAREGKKPASRLFRIEPKDAPIELMTIDPVEGAEEGRTITLFGWIVAGFEHILPKGLDHILFILGLFFLQQKPKPLLAQSLAFTVAHSITLAMVVVGVFTINARFVESMIALSIAYVGIENLWVRELKPWRIAFVFALGLLHGMGFASVMQELDIPPGSVIEPLLGFNIGVEAGQVTVLILAFLVWLGITAMVRRIAPRSDNDDSTSRWMRKLAMGSSAAIAAVGLYWTFERALG